MARPTHGYANDIPYTRGVYRELAPHWLEGALTLAGHAPPPACPAPVWIELGCGHGLSALVLAAARPDLRVIGVDFNPEHIAGAQALARAAGLDNAHFHDADFADMAASPQDWPMADHIALHGVYTWVGAQSREHITRFIDQRLKPGGAVYVGYNCLPGWAPSLPVQYLLRAYGAALPGPSVDAAMPGRDMLLGLLNQGAGFFAGNPAASTRVARLRQAPDAYLVHEFMHAGWQPLYHAQLAEDLAAVGLDYAASAAWGENFTDLLMTPAQAALRAQAPTPALRETVKDYLTAQPLRRDIFVRGARPLDPAARAAALGALRLAAWGDAAAHLPPITLPIGEPEPDVVALFAPLRDHFAQAAGPLASFPGWDGAGTAGTGAIERAVALLVAADVLTPLAPLTPTAQTALRRLDAAAGEAAVTAAVARLLGPVPNGRAAGL